MEDKRLTSLCSQFQVAGISALALNPGPMLTYLTGLRFHLSERPTVLFLAQPHLAVLVLPELENEKLKQAKISIKAFTYGDDPSTWQAAFQRASQLLRLPGQVIGVEPTRWRYLEMIHVQNASPGVGFKPVEDMLSSLRMVKDENEIANMRTATRIAQQALEATIPFLKPGISEREVATELTLQLMRAGCDPELPFAPIVSSGANSANPHASPSDRRLTTGDLLVIDWGASYNGYFSDLTRTFAVGKIKPEYGKIHRTVLEANTEARACVRPGITAGEVDQTARNIIEAAGYGQYFTHRVGHGLGMEGHEQPYMFASNSLVLTPGMTFTIEPGIYLPERGGVRIEDDMVVTPLAGESLSDMSRELRII